MEFARSRLLSTSAKLRLPRLLLEITRHRRILDPYHPERAAAIDREDLARGLTRIVGEEAAEYLFVPAFSSTFDADPEDLSSAFALLSARFVLSGFRLQAFDGGIGLLTQTLAEQVPVRTGCEATAIETSADGARVTIRSRGPGGSDDRVGEQALLAVAAAARLARPNRDARTVRAGLDRGHFATRAHRHLFRIRVAKRSASTGSRSITTSRALRRRARDC
ncbi:MAG: FAD-dependent oxidoreductase [Proteobacteria bacterium]|nr:FAD-dependent oxidoreductase [Pseudomonadota bacterium]